MEKIPVIGVVGGKGRMGALFAEFFKSSGINVLISDIKTKLSNKDIAEKSDIVIVSVPIDVTKITIEGILPYMKKDSAIMDFTSVKDMAVKAMLKGKSEVLGIHPMFGNSNPIPGQTVILCPTKKSGKWSKWIEEFLIKNQVKIIKMSAAEHDKIMNIAQGLVHFAEVVFADSLRKTKVPINEILKYTGKASELKILLAARLIDQDAALYGNIQIENSQALKSLKLFKESVEDLYKIVAKKNLKGFKKYFENNKKYLGKYTQEAFEDSTYMIDKLLELQNRRANEKHTSNKPDKNAIAILGPKNTYSDIAAANYLQNKTHKKYYAHDIEEISELVEQKKVKEGILPIENKLQGTIRESLDALFLRKIHIVREISLDIHHNLITLPHSKKEDIKVIISHSQALNQCKNYLRKNFPKIQKEATTSTAAAIQKLLNTRDKHLAVIAPKIAAEANNLKIFASDIGDSKENSTNFIIIKPGEFSEKDCDKTANKTSIAFHFTKDSPGSLFTVFKDFADAKINMTRIESRPTKAAFGDYIFYLDFEGNVSESKIKKALEEVSKKVAKLKILGSYII